MTRAKTRKPKKVSTAKVQRWRDRNPDLYRERQRAYQAAYRARKKG